MRLRIFVILLLTLAAAHAATEPPIRVLIVTGLSDIQYHDWHKTTASLRSALERTGRFEVTVIEEPRGLTPASLEGYDALLLNYLGPRWTAATETAIEQFVKSGKGLIAFHMACYGPFYGMQWRDGRWQNGSDRGWRAFADMVGSSWTPEKLGHAVRHVFPVEFRDRNHPITAGMAPEFMANDELYHKLEMKPQAHVLADAYSDPARGGTGRREPLMWTVPYGKGRVFFTPMGHDVEALYMPGIRSAFVRGVEWAATGKVTIPPIDPERALAEPGSLRVLLVTGGHGYPTAVYSLFNSMPGIAWKHAMTNDEAFDGPLEKDFDVVVLHDMQEKIGEKAQARLKAFLESGKGVVSTHHAIVDYTSWPWWYEEVIGGKYFVEPVGEHKKSAYHEGVDFLVTPVKEKREHPVLAGVGPLWVHDEAYLGMWHSPRIEVLMETDYKENDRPVVYVGPYAKARVVYIQLGHSEHTMLEPNYQRLVRNAVFWTGKRN